MDRFPTTALPAWAARPLTRERTLRSVERMSALTHLVSGLEYLTAADDRGPGGVNDWSITRRNFRSRSRWTRTWMDAAARPDVTWVIRVGQVAASVALLSPAGRRTRAIASTFLATTDLVSFPSRRYGTDGSDQVGFLVQASAAAARLADRPRTTDAVLWYVALQSTLSYAVSGWAKVAGSSWRSGEALTGVLRTVTYGHGGLWRLADRYPRAARAIATGTVALECTFPLLYARGGVARHLFVGSAALFHVGVAHVMGLNRFLTAFTSMHPAVLYTAGPRSRQHPDGAWERRDDVVPAMVAIGAALSATALGIAQLRRGAAVRAGRGDEQFFRTSTGSVLAYRCSEEPGRDGPLVVFENGLGTSAEFWEWIRGAVGRDADVLTYDRAGSGRSTAAPGRTPSIEDSLADASELITAKAGGRPVVIVGHSLGGYLAWRTACRRPDVIGLVLVDSSHPAELVRSEKQETAAEDMDRQLATLERSLQFGLGALITTPYWSRHLPEHVQALALDQQRHAATWRGARHEWAAAVRAFGDDDHALTPLGVPVLVLTAALTLEIDPVVLELHNDLVARAGPGSVRHTVPDCTHETILVRREPAERVAGMVAGFVEDRARHRKTVVATAAGQVPHPVAGEG